MSLAWAVPAAAAAVDTAAAFDQAFQHRMNEMILLRLLSLQPAPSGALLLPSSAPFAPFVLAWLQIVVVVAASVGLRLKDPPVRFPYPVQRVLGERSCHHAFLLCLLIGVLLGLSVAT